MIKLDLAHKNFIKHLENEGKSASTLLAYGKDIEQLTDFLLKRGINSVPEIEINHLQDFMAKLSADNFTPKTISRKTNATKTFFKYLEDKGHIQNNVADLLKHPKLQIRAPRILSRLEYGALRDAARNDIRAYGMIEVLLQTGVTISELSEIKVEYLDLNKAQLAHFEGAKESGVLSIPKKTGRDARSIPLNKRVVEAIKNYMEKERADKDSKFLFVTKSGNPVLIRNIRATIDRYFKAAGVENAKVNDLRHTFVAFHLGQGTNISLVSKVAGHKRISTTERYLQYIEKSNSVEKMEFGIL